MNDRSIGVFDSGLGGLTVLKEMMDMLPNENIIYFGDTARVPYGPRTEEEVRKFTFQAINFFISKNVKAVVIACNTATARALDEAQKRYDIPIIGVIEAGAKTAIKHTKNKTIGVIGTEGTIDSRAYNVELNRLDSDVKVVSKACPLFVPIVEDGWANTMISYYTVNKYLDELKTSSIDTLVLGCTHYPHLQKEIGEVMGEDVILINPAKETVMTLRNLLEEKKMNRIAENKGKCKYYSSNSPSRFAKVASEIMKQTIDDMNEVEIESY